MKAIFTALGLGLLLAAVPATADDGLATKAQCKVTRTDGQFQQWMRLARTPQIGETTEIDLTAKEIDNFKFSGGGLIPLKSYKAKLVRVGKVDQVAARYEGTHKSLTSTYEGILQGFAVKGPTDFTLQYLTAESGGLLGLATLTLACEGV